MSAREYGSDEHYDIVIVGSGMGGSAIAYALRETNLKILILERGSKFRQEPQNWEPDEVITERRYDPDDTWLDSDGRPFTPRTYYTTGGSSKFFGGTSFRFRKADFDARELWAKPGIDGARQSAEPEGSTIPWPLTYEDLAPYYGVAERAMRVHGLAGADPTEPPRGEYPHEPLEDEPAIAWLRSRLEEQGLNPFPLPIAVHQGRNGTCRKGSPCDGFPCKIRAKGDGENAFLRPAIRSNQAITLETESRVMRLDVNDRGDRVVSALVRTADGSDRSVTAGTFILAAGAVNTAALLLQSTSDRHPDGLGNGSGVVGRHFMAHNSTVLMAFSPFRKNPTQFQKTLAINDYYADLGNVQMRGKVLPQNLARSPRLLRRLFRNYIAARSFDFWVMSEDLPDPDNRVTVGEDQDGRPQIQLSRTLNTMKRHRALVQTMRRHIRRAGLPFVLARTPSPSAIQHQVGTVRFGHDPATSALNPDCRSWEVNNLYVVDGSVFPSSAAVNPALTIAANALRVGAHLRERLDPTH